MNWLIKDDKLSREFSFSNQSELAVFVLKIAQYADKVAHHPDMYIYKCSQLKIELFTHDLNAIGAKDYAMAAYIDELPLT
jgi:4a-hydroxytetrahydrobiopterin dehydratase